MKQVILIDIKSCNTVNSIVKNFNVALEDYDVQLPLFKLDTIYNVSNEYRSVLLDSIFSNNIYYEIEGYDAVKVYISKFEEYSTRTTKKINFKATLFKQITNESNTSSEQLFVRT